MLSAAQLEPWVSLHSQLCALSDRRWALETPGPSLVAPDEEERLHAQMATLRREVDRLTFDLLGLRPDERALIEDFVSVRFKLMDGKIPAEATDPPSSGDLMAYAETLRDTLDAWFTEPHRLRQGVTIWTDQRAGAVRVRFVPQESPIPALILTPDADEAQAMRDIRRRVDQSQGQWLYLNRNLFQYVGEELFIHKPMMRRWWLRSQALSDADRIIADLIAAGGAQ